MTTPKSLTNVYFTTSYQANALERDAELGTEDLGERRGVALAVIEGAGDDCHVAVWLKADAAHLAAGWSGQFEVVADPPPTQPAARPALFLARGKAVPR